MNAQSATVAPWPGERVPVIQPPMILEAEQAVIGAVFANRDVFDEVRFLQPTHFAAAANARIWEMIAAMADAGRVADPVTMARAVGEDPVIADAGGVRYIAQLAGSAVGRINAVEYARLIVDTFERREVIAIAQRMIETAISGPAERSAREIIAEAEEDFAGFDVHAIDGPRPFEATVDEAVGAIERTWRGEGPLGVPTRLTDVDEMTGGLFPGDLTVLAGATSMGKTALANTIVEGAARQGIPCLVFSLEMPGQQLAMREVAAQTGVPIPAMRAGRLTGDDMGAIIAAGQDVRQLPIWVDDRSGMSLGMIAATTKRMIRKAEVKLVVVDYLQLVQPSDRYQGNRVQEVSAIARGLKDLARSLGVPILALSQLSRALGARENKRPTLGDLKESGEIETAADNVMGVYREFYYLNQAEPRKRENESAEAFTGRLVQWQSDLEACRNDAEVIVMKQRNGAQGKILLHYDSRRMRFGNRVRM